LNEITFNTNGEKGIQTINQEAFTNCTSLKEIDIPEGVTTIPTLTFRNCTSLEKITLPPTITFVGADAFELNTTTKELHISDLSSYVKIAFEDAGASPLYSSTDKNSAIYVNGEKLVDAVIDSDINKYTFIKVNSIESLTIANGVKSIGRYSLASMSNLKTVHLSNTLTSVDNTAFNACSNIEVVTLEDGFNTNLNISFSTLYSVDTMVAMFNALATTSILSGLLVLLNLCAETSFR
jgi:hypothetical protein